MEKPPPQRTFNPFFFKGEWKEYERYVKEGKPILYPVDAKNVSTHYSLLQRKPLIIRLVNSYEGKSVLGYQKVTQIQGIATGTMISQGRAMLDVDFEVCCGLIPIHGTYEVIDYEEKNGRYTHLFVGDGSDGYRWILVRDLNNVDEGVVKRFKDQCPLFESEFFKSKQ